MKICLRCSPRWENETVAGQGELNRQILSLKKMIKERSHLGAIEIITSMRKIFMA